MSGARYGCAVRFLTVFAIISVAEIATFIAVEGRIGLGWSLLIALGTAVIGSILVRRAGAAAWARLRSKVAAGGVPGREVGDGAAILVAGALLISPGFLTDAIGFALLVPAVREVLYRRITSRLGRGMRIYVAGGPYSVNEGEIIDVEEIP